MNPDNAKTFSLLGIVFVVAGVLTLVLALFNYLQDGKISMSAGIAFLSIFLGLMFYSRGKSPKGQGE